MSKRVLIVDDEPTILDILSRLLTDVGWEATAAKSLAEAQGAVGPFDLVIADVQLPNGDGRFLRSLMAGVPFLVISGFPDEVRAEDQFLMKPFTRSKLLSKLAEFVPGIPSPQEPNV